MGKNTKAKNQMNKIPAWVWAISGILVGMVIAWIAVEYAITAGKVGNGEQSASEGRYGATENSVPGGIVSQPQANAGAAAGEINSLQQQNRIAGQQQQAAQTEIASLQQANQAAAEQQQATTLKGQELTQLFTIGNTLQDYYNKIRDAQALGALWCLFGSQCETSFAADLAQHDMGVNVFERKYVTDYDAIYHTQTAINGSSGSYSYLDAKTQLDKLVSASYAAGVNYSQDSDAVKIEKILDFVDANITYKPDMQETPRAPVETLGLKSGDCKSYSILVSAALADAGVESAIMYVKSVSDPTGDGHVMVLVQSNENLPLAESYSDLTQYGLPAGRWWVIEPQYTFAEQQQHPAWFAEWKINHAASVGKYVNI